jgi:putative hydrolase of HD superfamily
MLSGNPDRNRKVGASDDPSGKRRPYYTINFILEIDKLEDVLRKVRPIGEQRYENTADHSWQIALLALSLAQSLKVSIDWNRAVAMLLMHNVGEIDAGGQICLRTGRVGGTQGSRTAGSRADCWPRTQNNRGVPAQSEEGVRCRRKRRNPVCQAIDRCMPVLLLNLSNGGGSWLENGVSYERVIGRVGPEVESGCPERWDYLEATVGRGTPQRLLCGASVVKDSED